jgi:hypothetical protein
MRWAYVTPNLLSQKCGRECVSLHNPLSKRSPHFDFWDARKQGFVRSLVFIDGWCNRLPSAIEGRRHRRLTGVGLTFACCSLRLLSYSLACNADPGHVLYPCVSAHTELGRRSCRVNGLATSLLRCLQIEVSVHILDCWTDMEDPGRRNLRPARIIQNGFLSSCSRVRERCSICLWATCLGSLHRTKRTG